MALQLNFPGLVGLQETILRELFRYRFGPKDKELAGSMLLHNTGVVVPKFLEAFAFFHRVLWEFRHYCDIDMDGRNC